ncbi:hypothetical protein MBLNU230_g7186t1 [Neophaeotheca triangularis]
MTPIRQNDKGKAPAAWSLRMRRQRGLPYRPRLSHTQAGADTVAGAPQVEPARLNLPDYARPLTLNQRHPTSQDRRNAVADLSADPHNVTTAASAANARGSGPRARRNAISQDMAERDPDITAMADALQDSIIRNNPGLRAQNRGMDAVIHLLEEYVHRNDADAALGAEQIIAAAETDYTTDDDMDAALRSSVEDRTVDAWQNLSPRAPFASLLRAWERPEGYRCEICHKDRWECECLPQQPE